MTNYRALSLFLERMSHIEKLKITKNVAKAIYKKSKEEIDKAKKTKKKKSKK